MNPYVFITKANLLMLFNEWIYSYNDNYNETIKVLCQQNSPFCFVKTNGVYSYHWILKGLNYEMATISDARKLFYTTWNYFAKNVSLISTLYIWTSRIYSSDNGVITHAILSAGNMCLIHYLRRIQNLWLSFPLNNTKSLHALLFQERAQSVKRCLLQQHCLKHTSSHF